MSNDVLDDDLAKLANKDDLFDPLLQCLVIITQLKHNPFSAVSLVAGLPLVNNHLTPELFVRAAERAGLTSEIKKRALKKISPLLLPVVLMLKNGNACVVTSINNNNTADVIFPDVAEGTKRINLSELDKEYTGYVFLIQQRFEFESRAEEESKRAKPRSWFWGTIWRFKQYYYRVFIASFFINLFALTVPLFIRIVYDRVVPNNATDTLWVLVIGVGIIFAFDFVIKTLRSYFLDMAGKKVDIILASRLFEQTLGIKMQHRPISAGVQANNIKEFENIRDFFASATISAFVDLPFIFLFIWIISVIGGSIAFVPLIAIPIVVVFSYVISGPLQHLVSRSLKGSAQKHAVLIESLNNLETIKSVSAEGKMLGRWEKFVGMSAEAALKSRFFSTLASNFTTIVISCTSVIVIIVGVYKVEARELTMGALICCTILAGRAMAPLAKITSLLSRYEMTKLSLKTLDSIMATPSERPLNHKFLHRPHFKGEIEFDDVKFKYPGQPSNLFKGISFKAKVGEHIGVLGSMGSGKTTLQKLVMGFYKPDEGAIRIDGTDIEQIDPANLRRHIAYVPQEPQLFYGSARENITMKAPWVDDQAVLDAAKRSGADQFIGKHPAGYDMPIGEAGHGLSGGQAQTITVARAMLLDPPILLFDEPTSSMDNSSEQQFINHMLNYIDGKTLILVTHRMPLLDLVNRLIILKDGKIVADGTKEYILEMLKKINT